MTAASAVLFSVFLCIGGVLAQDVPTHSLKAEHRGDNCDCMEYWSCITRGGAPYSYCGVSENSVCCLLRGGSDRGDGAVPSGIRGKPKCGVKGFDSGRDGYAEPSEWPWHVAIVEEPGFYYVCGGSLVDEFWVLTAAHCVDNYYGNKNFKLKVRLGEYDVTTTSESLRHEDRAIEKIVLHPNFDNETLSNDIALLKMQYAVKQRPHIDVICLPKQSVDFPLRSKCVVTGWGRESEDSNFSEILKEIVMPLWDSSACEGVLKREFGSGYVLSNSSICAGAPGRDACDGDGGGPLVCQKEGQWYQVGIVSFGIGCGKQNSPGVYTSVREFEKWIRETVLFSKIKF